MTFKKLFRCDGTCKSFRVVKVLSKLGLFTEVPIADHNIHLHKIVTIKPSKNASHRTL